MRYAYLCLLLIACGGSEASVWYQPTDQPTYIPVPTARSSHIVLSTTRSNHTVEDRSNALTCCDGWWCLGGSGDLAACLPPCPEHGVGGGGCSGVYLCSEEDLGWCCLGIPTDPAACGIVVWKSTPTGMGGK